MTSSAPAELAERAFAATREQVDAVGPAELALPTPCSAWDVRMLVNHVIGGAHWYGEAMRDRVTPPVDDDDHAAGDLRGAYAEGIRQALDAFAAPGALEASISFVGRPVRGSTVMRLCALDTFVHGWDLARALGRSTDLDPAVADVLLTDVAPRLPESFRGAAADALYRPPAAAPPDATPADRLAAHLGRAVTAS